jgi:hypothetical protein
MQSPTYIMPLLSLTNSLRLLRLVIPTIRAVGSYIRMLLLVVDRPPK